ncbi:uncharacterized protein LOC124355924 [Homalodisca vitripennis]|nr:uncharacterized protein LOC124355924 [Homalodisca vitripennis]
MEGATETVPFQEMRNSLSQVDGLQERLKKLEDMLESLKDLGTVEDKGTVGQRLDFLETTLSGHDEQLTNINGTLEEKLPYITEQFEELHQEMGLLNEKVNVKNVSAFDQRSVQERRVSSTPDQTTSSINNIIARLSSVQHDLDNLTMVTTNLTEEQDQRQMMIDTLSEQIEVLKVAKADKTNVEDILASKADMSQVHRKVSHDHFEIKIEGLSAKMDDAFNRLDVHEDMWQEEVELLKADIENKMDKTEFSPLKDYVNEKLKQIQDKMKILAAQRREGEAAGSKRKIISVLINSVILDAGSSDSWPRDMITWVQRFEILNLRETEANRNDPARTNKCPGVLL